MERVVPWPALCGLIEPFYPKPGHGRPPVGVERMLRIYFVQQWFNLSDPAVEEALYDSLAMRGFVGIDLGREPVPSAWWRRSIIADGGRGGLPGARHAIAFGVSQAGRFLRHFLELGMNDDGHGRRVFDGVLTHVAGAGKVFANHSFAMPGRTATQHEDRLYPENWFPFTNAVTTDLLSGQRSAILNGRPTDPLVIEVSTSTEYWQKGASLVHTNPADGRDAELPPTARVYMIAGTQHGGRPGTDPNPGPCVNPRNPHSATPALRALFVALEEWVRTGIAPPPSSVPSFARGTAVVAEAVTMPNVPGFAPPPGANRIGPPIDWVEPPTKLENFYDTRVCAVDADGNEVAGVRLPSIAVPLGTYLDGTSTGRKHANFATVMAR